MHRDHAVGRRPQRVVGGQRLGIGRIEEGAGDGPALQRRHQRRLVDHVAARDVDQPRRRLHRRQLVGADHRARLAGRWRGEDDPVVLAEAIAPRVGRQRAVAARPGDAGDRDPERGEPVADQPADRAIADDQRARAVELDLAGRVLRPLVAVVRADHLVEALGGGEHAHHRIFGDRDRVDPGAVGQRHPSLAQQIERKGVEPGVDRRHPFQRGGARADRVGDEAGRLHVDPGDLGVGDAGVGLGGGGEPSDLEVVGQLAREQRLRDCGQDRLHLSVPPRRSGSPRPRPRRDRRRCAGRPAPVPPSPAGAAGDRARGTRPTR